MVRMSFTYFVKFKSKFNIRLFFYTPPPPRRAPPTIARKRIREKEKESEEEPKAWLHWISIEAKLNAD